LNTSESDVTAGDLWARREQLEEAAARVLGRMLFEFSRLDMAAGLCAVWVEGGQKLEQLNRTVPEMNFNGRLRFIEATVLARLPAGSKRQKAYLAWLERAHAAREKRNELVHGRWGIEPDVNQLVNVVGLPTSPEQREVRYTVADLEQALGELCWLQTELHRLRMHWPL